MQCLAQRQHLANMTPVSGLMTIECIGGYQKNESLVCKGLATRGLWNILYPEINMALVWFCGGKEVASSTKGQYFILKPWFQPCFYSLPRMPSGSHGRGSWFKLGPKKGSLDWTLRGMTRRGQGQGGDPKCPPGQKQWVTLGPKYKLCECHFGKPVPSADQGGQVFWEELRNQLLCASPCCQPSFSE